MDDDVYFCPLFGGTIVWPSDNEADQSGYVAGDDILAAILIEEGTATQPCGSGNEWENQIQGAADGIVMTGDHVILEIPPRRTSQEAMNLQKLAALNFEEPSPTQYCGSGSTSEDAVGLPGPSSSQGFDEILATALPQETVNRQSKTKGENGKRRQRSSNWLPDETSCFLKHMETAAAEKHKPPWRAVSEAMKLDGHYRDKRATESRYGVLLKDLRDNRLASEWLESMLRILHLRPRVCRKLKSPATPPTPSTPSGTDIEELSSLIAKRNYYDDQINRVRGKQNRLSKAKTRKKKMR